MLKVVANTIAPNTRSYRRIMNIGKYDVVDLCHPNLFYYMTIGHLDLLLTIIGHYFLCLDHHVLLWFLGLRFRFIVLNATFNNISAISWRSVLLVEETGVLGENHHPVASY